MKVGQNNITLGGGGGGGGGLLLLLCFVFLSVCFFFPFIPLLPPSPSAISLSVSVFPSLFVRLFLSFFLSFSKSVCLSVSKLYGPGTRESEQLWFEVCLGELAQEFSIRVLLTHAPLISAQSTGKHFPGVSTTRLPPPPPPPPPVDRLLIEPSKCD